jgi:hypothetical protein
MTTRKSQEIAVFAPGLPETPGWNELTREKQSELAEITSRLVNYRSMEGLGIVGQCIELVHARQALQGQPMTITSYTETVFQQGFRTAWRRLAEFEELSNYWPEEITKVLAERGATLLRGAAGGGMRELINVAKALPPPKSTSPKVIEGFIEKDVREKLRERRRARKPGGSPEALDKKTGLKIAVNTVIRIIRNVRLRTVEQEKEWLASMTGMVMQHRMIPGTLRTSAVEIPDGLIARRGPKPKHKRNAA